MKIKNCEPRSCPPVSRRIFLLQLEFGKSIFWTLDYGGVPMHEDCNTAYPLSILRFLPIQADTPFQNCGTGIILDDLLKHSCRSKTAHIILIMHPHDRSAPTQKTKSCFLFISPDVLECRREFNRENRPHHSSGSWTGRTVLTPPQKNRPVSDGKDDAERQRKPGNKRERRLVAGMRGRPPAGGH